MNTRKDPIQNFSCQAYSFADFTLDLSRGCLLHRNREVKLRNKSYEVLKYLVEHRGRLIGKEELIGAVWPDSFVTDDSLSHCLMEVRHALGDASQEILKTVPRRGYLFDVEVRELHNHVPSGTIKSKPQDRSNGLVEVEKVEGINVVVEAGELASTESPPDNSGPIGGNGPVAAVTAASRVRNGVDGAPVLRPVRPWTLTAAASGVVAIAVAVWLFRGTARKPAAAPELLPLTTYSGSEESPSFSPDGNQVAFSWNGEKEDNWDIYVTLIGSSTPLRLTSNPAPDVRPAFSPDGRSIGFIRLLKDRAVFVIIPSIGGPERVVAEVHPHVYSRGGHFGWFPDGKWVVIDGLELLSIETGEARRLTSPPSKLWKDCSPAVSPDGRTLAFSRGTSYFEWNVYLLDLGEDLRPKGEPRQLTFRKGFNLRPAWTPNGQEIIFSSAVNTNCGLWRIAVSGSGEPEQLPFGSSGDSPAISRSRNRLAYERFVEDNNIWRLSLSGPGVAAGSPARFIASTQLDFSPRYSPDGKRIAFSSNRGAGLMDVWVSDADGSNPVELFSQPRRYSGSPSWSPDGQRLAFDSSLEGNMDIYVIRASGGKPVRLTTDPTDDNVPNWSRDGNWIYFASLRSGRYEIWKAPSGGGEAVQVTSNGGDMPLESPNGKFVYYTKGPDWTMGAGNGALWRIPVTGGEEVQVLPSVSLGAFSLIDDGIYFIPEPGADGKSSIQFLTLTTGKIKTVAPILAPPFYGLTVSPDRRYLLYSQIDEHRSDLMLVENFR